MVLSMERECVTRKNKEKSRLGFRRCFSFILSLIITVTVVLQCLPPMQIYAEDSEQINYSNEMLLKALVNYRPFVIEMLTGDECPETNPNAQIYNSILGSDYRFHYNEILDDMKKSLLST